MSPETLNTLLNSLTALLIAFGGVAGYKVVRRGTGEVAEKTEDAGTRIVKRLESMERNLRGLHSKVDRVETRVDQIETQTREGATEDG
jgi:hypothetical protein